MYGDMDMRFWLEQAKLEMTRDDPRAARV